MRMCQVRMCQVRMRHIDGREHDKRDCDSTSCLMNDVHVEAVQSIYTLTELKHVSKRPSMAVAQCQPAGGSFTLAVKELWTDG